MSNIRGRAAPGRWHNWIDGARFNAEIQILTLQLIWRKPVAAPSIIHVELSCWVNLLWPHVLLFLNLIVWINPSSGERWRGPVVVVLLSNPSTPHHPPPCILGSVLLSMHVLFQQHHASHSCSAFTPGICPTQQQSATVSLGGNRISRWMNIW